ncbi:MAG: phosphoglycerate mutase (2,3-diphosphoglycerate-independent) [candidate division Zixibacteria bacterium RBG_16_48_11]|nr:MAG: phosphoglycerate mutase (2,3-diphosphoglycerate-independent) [candidate division Zixibacteria bacterium RBG_16_48_11]
MGPLILMILDGYGLNPNPKGNAVAMAKKPNLDRIFSTYPYTTIKTSGLDVGLPEGQMGNSEVGHLNIGAGRIVYQDITRIDKAIKEGSFFQNRALLSALHYARDNQKALHLMGLVSDGGVHSSLNHLYALLEMCKREKIEEVYLHAYLDGRDTSPTAGVNYIKQVLDKMTETGVGKIATMVGRYYGMDRDKRWDRLQKAYQALVQGEGLYSTEPLKAIKDYYADNITDEFMLPVVLGEKQNGRLSGRIKDGDGVIFFNFRADRGREMSFALTDPNFKEFPTCVRVRLTTMCWYHDNLKAEIAFPQETLTNILSAILSRLGKRQLRISETEKYAHVTFFFNGGVETPFPGEDRTLIDSSKVATYDLKPEMSAYEITEKLLQEIAAKKYEVIILNYANCDMVGHTGVIPAAVKAVETVDECTGRVVEAILKQDGCAILTADHGNCEMMIDYQTGGPHTAHTTLPVPFCVVKNGFNRKLKSGGKLANIAPTMLELLGIPRPAEMNEPSLLA